MKTRFRRGPRPAQRGLARLRAALVALVAAGTSVGTFANTPLPGPSARGAAPQVMTCQPNATAERRSADWWTAASRVLAGLEPIAPDPLVAVSARDTVVEHRSELGTLWDRFDAARLQPIRGFSAREFGPSDAGSGSTPHPAPARVYYPFSGPDAAYALAFFPDARALVFTGLEPVGDLPDLALLDDQTLDGGLDQLRNALRSILALSFFVTREMDSDLRRNRLSGVTPILMLFLARHGYRIQAVEPFVLETDGRLCATSAPALKEVRSKDHRVPGVQVRFVRPGDPVERSITYLRADLSNAGLVKRPHYLKLVQAFDPQITLVKAASYLLHLREFTTLRDHILAQSPAVLQDDTGIQLRFYRDAQWERRLYGAYVGPIEMFKARHQAEMRDAYREAARPLGFGIGYRYESHESNLQLFRRRSSSVVALQ